MKYKVNLIITGIIEPEEEVNTQTSLNGEDEVRYNSTGQKLASDFQIAFLENRGIPFELGITRMDAFLKIRRYKDEEKKKKENRQREGLFKVTEENQSTYPWEEQLKKKRGRPKKKEKSL